MSIHFRDSAEGMMDIHRYLDLKVGDGSVLNDDFFRRAVPAKVFGVDTLIPSREDMLFIALANLSKTSCTAPVRTASFSSGSMPGS